LGREREKVRRHPIRHVLFSRRKKMRRRKKVMIIILYRLKWRAERKEEGNVIQFAKSNSRPGDRRGSSPHSFRPAWGLRRR